MFLYAGLVIIGSGFFDLVDGRVARATNQVTRFGAFFDSVVDRYSDASQFFGLLVFYARGDRFFYVVLAALVMISCDHGQLHPRPRRVADRIPATSGSWNGRSAWCWSSSARCSIAMAPVLWVIAVLSTITVIHRIHYTWLQTERARISARRGRPLGCLNTCLP